MRDLNVAWSDVHPGMRVRWLTPSFHKTGVVMAVKRSSMRVQLDGESKPRNIPDARWYWVQAKLGDKQNQLTAISPDHPPIPQLDLSRSSFATDDLMPVGEACALFGVEPKRLRSLLRKGRVAAVQRSGAWQVSAESLGRYLADRR